MLKVKYFIADLYQELRLVRIREYELPTLQRAVIIHVPAEIEKTQNVVHQGLEFFSHNIMNQDSNNKLSETKLLQHQNTFQNMEKGQVVNLKISKTQPSKNQEINNIETPIELEKKCMSLKKKENPAMEFLEELKERVSKLNRHENT